MGQSNYNQLQFRVSSARLSLQPEVLDSDSAFFCILFLVYSNWLINVKSLVFIICQVFVVRFNFSPFTSCSSVLAIETRWFFYPLDVSFVWMRFRDVLRLYQERLVSAVILVRITAFMLLPA